MSTVIIDGNPKAITGGTFTTGTASVATNALSSNSSRQFLLVQNTDSIEIRVRVNGTASATEGMILEPGIIYDWPAHATPTGAVSVFSTKANHTLTVLEV